MAATLTFDILAKDRASRTLKNVGTSAEKTSKKFSGLKTAAAAAGVAAGVFLLKFGKDSVKAFTEAEAAQTKLQDAFARFPKLADSNIQAFRDLNTELAKKTKFDDDAYASGQAVLAQFGLTGKQIKNITPLLGDYAAKTGRDIPTSAKILGKAFLGNTRALKDLGIAYKPTGDKAKDMARIQELVNQKVGGFAEKQGKTAAGQAEILKNQFGELQETVGSKLLPVLSKLVGWGLKIVAWMQKNSDVVLPLVGALAAMAVTFKAVNVAMLLLSANPIVLIATAIAGLVIGLVIAYKKFKTFRDIVDAVFSWIKKNWPLLLGILTGPFGLAIVEIIKHRDTIWNAFKAIYNWFKNTWDNIYGFVVDVFNSAKKTIQNIAIDIARAFLNTLSTIVNAAAKIPGPLGAPFRKAKEKIDDAKRALDGLQRKINMAHGKELEIKVKMQMQNRLKIAAAQGVALTITGKPIPLARGGPIHGPGSGTSDSVPAMLSTGEYVVKAKSARKLGPQLLNSLNRVGDVGGDVAGMVVSTGKRLKLAAGGMVAAQRFVRAQGSDPYVWGGTGPFGFDCSGLVGAAAAVARGLANPFQRFMTTASNFARLGWQRGLGAFTMGVNPSTHMAGNVGGLPFEAASTRLGIRVGGRATPVTSFAQQWHLPQFGNVFGGMGSVALGPNDLRKLMRAISINWGVPAVGRVQTFDRGGRWASGTVGFNTSGRTETVVPGEGRIRLHPADIKALGEVMGRVVLNGLGASNASTSRRVDVYARAG